MGCFGLPLVRLGWKWFRMSRNWYRTLLDPFWTLFGSLMDLFWPIFMFLDYCWITAGWSLLLPYCCPIVALLLPLANGPGLVELQSEQTHL